MPRPVLLVTGAGSGVGRSIAHRFAADGFAVACAGRGEEALRATVNAITSDGGEAMAVRCDVAERDQVDAMVEAAGGRLGPIDVLVNSAGISESAPFTAMPDELWHRTLAINLTGTYFCMRAVAPGMFERRRGRIINIASTAALVGYPYTAAYVASKHGVLGLTRSVALEAAGRGVTVNAICPGWIDTPMTERSIARIVARTGRTAVDARRAVEQMNPSGRLIAPEDVARLAAYLASAEANEINGQALDV